jgi:hypothetical protein
MPVVYKRFFEDSQVVFEKSKEVLRNQSFTITFEDPEKGIIHAHKDDRGVTHVELSIGQGRDRGTLIDIKQGGEGRYRDVGLRLLNGLSSVLR